jgi:hypothetical protein
MMLISLKVWDKLLSINVEDNGQIWLSESGLMKPSHGLKEYSYKDLLLEWNPPQAVKPH